MDVRTVDQVGEPKSEYTTVGVDSRLWAWSLGLGLGWVG